VPEDPDRRHLIDPRYVTWEVFEARWREVNDRFTRDEREAEMRTGELASQLGLQAQELVRLRIASARQAVYISLAQAAITVGATAWITFVIGRH
jgi:hypothetical protein